MAGPWENYQTKETGPWATYQTGTAPKKPKMSLSGLLENAGKELLGALETAAQAPTALPSALLKTPVQMARGTPLKETELGQQAFGMVEAVKQIPSQVGEAVKHPLQTAYENPLAAATLAYGGGIGAAKIGAKALRGVGSAFESAGARGVNYAVGLRPQTIEAITKAGQNPVDVGVNIGSRLAQERIIGSTPKQTFDNLIKARQTAGSEVGRALKEIGNPTVDMDTALKPLLDATTERTGAITAARKTMGKPFEQVYNYLVETASKKGNVIGLEDIRKAMKEVGPMTHKGAEEVQAAMSELYGTLANVQDNIITQLANTAKKLDLKQALLKANEKYSLYSRILPDIERSASKAAAGKTSLLASPLTAAKQFAAAKGSGLMARTGTAMQGFPVAAQGANEAVLQAVRAKMGSQKGELTLGRPAPLMEEKGLVKPPTLEQLQSQFSRGTPASPIDVYIKGVQKGVGGTKVNIYGVKGNPKLLKALFGDADPGSVPEAKLRQLGLL
jgi:hypothetical protein